MARVTVEDCVQKVPNRFELVLLAAQRARNLSRGEELTIDRDNDKYATLLKFYGLMTQASSIIFVRVRTPSSADVMLLIKYRHGEPPKN